MKKYFIKKQQLILSPLFFTYFLLAITAVVFFLPMHATVVRGGPLLNTDLCELLAYFTTCTCLWWKWLADQFKSNAQ